MGIVNNCGMVKKSSFGIEIVIDRQPSIESGNSKP